MRPWRQEKFRLAPHPELGGARLKLLRPKSRSALAIVRRPTRRFEVAAPAAERRQGSPQLLRPFSSRSRRISALRSSISRRKLSISLRTAASASGYRDFDVVRLSCAASHFSAASICLESSSTSPKAYRLTG